MSKNLFDLHGRTALITGGNGGIGLGIAKGFAESGANIAIAGRNTTKTEEVVANFRERNTSAIGIEVDVADQESVQDMIGNTLEAFGRIDILVNNAGIGIRNLPHEYPLEDWNKVIDINLTGAFLCSKAVYPNMKTRGSGKIINIGSGKPRKIRNIIEHVKRISKGGYPQFGKIKLRKDEILKLYPNIKKAEKKINWRPKISFEKGLRRTINSFK